MFGEVVFKDVYTLVGNLNNQIEKCITSCFFDDYLSYIDIYLCQDLMQFNTKTINSLLKTCQIWIDSYEFKLAEIYPRELIKKYEKLPDTSQLNFIIGQLPVSSRCQSENHFKVLKALRLLLPISVIASAAIRIKQENTQYTPASFSEIATRFAIVSEHLSLKDSSYLKQHRVIKNNLEVLVTSLNSLSIAQISAKLATLASAFEDYEIAIKAVHNLTSIKKHITELNELADAVFAYQGLLDSTDVTDEDSEIAINKLDLDCYPLIADLLTYQPSDIRTFSL